MRGMRTVVAVKTLLSNNDNRDNLSLNSEGVCQKSEALAHFLPYSA